MPGVLTKLRLHELGGKECEGVLYSEFSLWSIPLVGTVFKVDWLIRLIADYKSELSDGRSAVACHQAYHSVFG